MILYSLFTKCILFTDTGYYVFIQHTSMYQSKTIITTYKFLLNIKVLANILINVLHCPILNHNQNNVNANTMVSF